MSVLFVGTGTNRKTGKPIVFRISDTFGSGGQKKSLRLLKANVKIDRLTDTATGELIYGSQRDKMDCINTAVAFESHKRAGVFVGGENLSLMKKNIVMYFVFSKLSEGQKLQLPVDARTECDRAKSAFREARKIMMVAPVLEYCRSHGQAISPELESALMNNADISKNPALKEEYGKLIGMYERSGEKSRK